MFWRGKVTEADCEEMTALNAFVNLINFDSQQSIMSPKQIIDPYNLTITLLITIGYQCLGFAIAWTLQFDKITE